MKSFANFIFSGKDSTVGVGVGGCMLVIGLVGDAKLRRVPRL